MTLRWERTPLIGLLYTRNAKRFPPNVRYGDIVRGLPVPENSSSAVYASHVLEHLALNEFERALENTRKILRPGGIFRMVVPDLEASARDYLRKLEAGDPLANTEFLTITLLGKTDRPRSLSGFLHKWLQTSEHQWMWDTLSLSRALEKHGFSRIRECSFGDCEDQLFNLVENPARFEGAVAIEARG